MKLVTLTRTHAALLSVALAGVAAACSHAQTQAPPQPTPSVPAAQIPQPSVRPTAPAPARAVIFLDPAHGGPETGASLGNNVAEKDKTLAFVQRLRLMLASAGFNIITTRDSDLSAALTTDQRAETANRVHALACLVIHATGAGSGVHLYTSTLPPAPASDNSGSASSQSDATTPFTPIPWESAQAGFVDQSRRFSDLLKATLAKSGLPVLTGTAPLRPLDNLMCPAVAIEIAPRGESGTPTSPTDTAYQQQITSAISSALEAWRTQNTPQAGGAP
jgi:N-acetylmuramoyl-L-alanine amidase